MKFYNWNKSIVSNPSRVFYPKNKEEIAELINSAITSNKKIKAVGKHRHVFSEISSVADNNWFLCMSEMDNIINIDDKNMTVTVESGCTLKTLNSELLKKGFCLNIMGGIDKQCIGGLIATATHGSSLKFGTFSDSVVAIELITCEGFIKKFDQKHEYFHAFATHLGALGIITSVTLHITPAYNLKQTIEDLPTLPTSDEMISILKNNDYCEILYFANTSQMVIRKRNRSEYRSRLAWFDSFKDDVSNSFQQMLIKIMKRHPSFISTAFGFAKRTIIGEREGPAPEIFIANDLHGAYNITDVLDQEYAFPIEKMDEVNTKLHEIFKKYSDVPIVGSIRFAPASENWIAPNYGINTVYFDVSILTVTPPPSLIAYIDKEMDEIGARPHWGKRNNVTRSYAEWVYPKFHDFEAVCSKFDPYEMFVNPYLSRLFG